MFSRVLLILFILSTSIGVYFWRTSPLPVIPLTQEEGLLPPVFPETAITQELPIIPELPPRQKIAQLLAVSVRIHNFSEPVTSAVATKIQHLQPGFIVLYGKQLPFTTVQKTTETLHALHPSILVMIDHEGGIVQRANGEGFTALPAWELLCRVETQQRKTILTRSATELSTAGVDIVLGPVLDFSPRLDSVLGNRICSQSPETLLSSTDEAINIYGKAKITPTLKHFPGIGALSVDLHSAFATTKDVPQELTLFTSLLQKYPSLAVMTSHAGFQNESVPCSLSPQCVQLLQSYPEALLITDDLYMISSHQNSQKEHVQELTDMTEQALLAQNTVILLGSDISLEETEVILQNLLQRYEQNRQFADAVDAAYQRVVRWRHNSGRDKAL